MGRTRDVWRRGCLSTPIFTCQQEGRPCVSGKIQARGSGEKGLRLKLEKAPALRKLSIRAGLPAQVESFLSLVEYMQMGGEGTDRATEEGGRRGGEALGQGVQAWVARDKEAPGSPSSTGSSHPPTHFSILPLLLSQVSLWLFSLHPLPPQLTCPHRSQGLLTPALPTWPTAASPQLLPFVPVAPSSAPGRKGCEMAGADTQRG